MRLPFYPKDSPCAAEKKSKVVNITGASAARSRIILSSRTWRMRSAFFPSLCLCAEHFSICVHAQNLFPSFAHVEHLVPVSAHLQQGNIQSLRMAQFLIPIFAHVHCLNLNHAQFLIHILVMHNSLSICWCSILIIYFECLERLPILEGYVGVK